MKRLAMRSAAQASAAFRFPAHSIAGRVGTSFKHEHLQVILADGKRDRFFEVHAENYMGAGGPPHAALNQIRQDYPVSLHGVCMSIGGPQPLDKAHLQRLKALVDRYETALVSSLGAAASAAFSESPSFDLPANICGLLEAGAFTAVLCAES